MNHHSRQPRPAPVTALELRSEIAYLRDSLSGGTLSKSGSTIFDKIREYKAQLVKLEPWLAE